MNIRKLLQKNGLTQYSFAELLNISRPTLNSYIKIFESGSSIPNEKFQIIFEELFNQDLSNDKFNKRLNKCHSLLQRDKAMGVLELEADATDLFTVVMNNIKNDFSSDDYDEDIYIFINILISSYKREKLFSHLVKYFLVLNNIISCQDINFKKEPYLLHYFSVFENDKKNSLIYDAILEKRFIERIEEIARIKRQSENRYKQNLIDLLDEEISIIKDMGLELTEEQVLKILLNKIRRD